MEAIHEPASDETDAEPLKGPVLVVDDDPRVRTSLTTILRSQGYAVTTAASGKEALRYLKHNPPPRLILSDLVMPDINGPRLRMELEQDPALAAIPLVIMSGTHDTRAEAFFLNAAGHLSKPIHLADLLAVLERLCP